MALEICQKRGDDISSEQQAVSQMPLRISAPVDKQKDKVS